jgi:elongation factor G
MAVPTERIRNVVLVGHNGNGKTSVAEAMLYRGGVVGRLGRVESGSTVCDFEPEEHDRRQSVGLALASFQWNGHKVNVIDTPGYADFVGEALIGLRVADLAVFVIDAVAGVQVQDEVLWREAASRGMPRMVFINKLDRDHASYDRTLAQLRERFASSYLEPIELPVGSESSFHGVADLLIDREFLYDSGVAVEADIDSELAAREREEHAHLVEDVVEADDELLERYLQDEEPSPEELERLLHDGVDGATLFPVLCGSATVPIAVDRLVDFICRVGPAPSDVAAPRVRAGDAEIEVKPDPHGDPLALVFKTRLDPYIGQLSMLRVLSGTLRSGVELANSRAGSSERLHQLVAVSGAGHETQDEATAGDLVAAVKLGGTATGDLLTPPGAPVRIEPFNIPSPVYGRAVRARSAAQEDRLAMALQRLQVEDPTISVHYEPGTRQTILSGLGEVQLQVAMARLERHGVEIDVDEQRVAYRECLTTLVSVEGKYKKQTGGHGQFGLVNVTFEPLPRGSGYEFVDKITGGAIPKGLIPAVSAGINDAMDRGGVYGFPLVDMRATLTDGKYHSVDSSEMSFKMAGSLALRAALESSGVTVLEPVSIVAVDAPAELQGDLLGDLSSRRGQVLGTDPGPYVGTVTLMARVPTAEILDYAITLRSITSGRGAFTTTHDGYEPLPANLVEKLSPQG